jgi:hypothetical protein
MEHALVRLAATAGWFFLIVFTFAAIGVFATIRWIVGLFTKTEQAVEGGIGHLKERL